MQCGTAILEPIWAKYLQRISKSSPSWKDCDRDNGTINDCVPYHIEAETNGSHFPHDIHDIQLTLFQLLFR